MPDYIRRRVPGGTWFFTHRLAQRGSDLLLREIPLLRDATRAVQAQRPFEIVAAVVLPDHLHMIWTLPPGDDDFPRRWSALKSAFSRHLPAAPGRTRRQVARGEKGIWQKRYWEHLIRDEADLGAHRRLIHAAPVQAGLCAREGDWPFSSIHRDGPVPGGHPLVPPGRPEARLTDPLRRRA